MHSAAAIEDRLFTPARIRLTAWYVGVLAAVLAVLGTALYLAVRQQLLNGVDNGIEAVAARARDQLVATNRVNLTGLSTGPYTVTWTPANGWPVGPKKPPSRVHFNTDSVRAAYNEGTDMRSSGASGDRQRFYSLRVRSRTGVLGVIQVARSTEPEHEALSKLLAGLLVGGAAGLILAGLGGWWLAGKSLAPVRLAFERQHAFVADASHELRTPLAVIRANAEFIEQEQPGNPEAREIVGETDRLSTLVDSLLAVARGDDSASAMHERVDIADLADSVVTAFAPLAEERSVALTEATADDLVVSGDREQLKQVIVILLDNAMRYTPEGGRIHVQARPDGRDAILTVHDTGIGISEDALPHVFERFYRGDEARNRQSGGVGLGLAIARDLVTRHGGRISVASTEGAGSTFTVELPRLQDEPRPRRAAQRSPAA